MITLVDVLKAYADNFLDLHTPIVFEHDDLWRQVKLEVHDADQGEYIVLKFDTDDLTSTQE